jgi:hypothetical protein
MFLGLLDPDPLVRGMDPDPDPSLGPRIVFDSNVFMCNGLRCCTPMGLCLDFQVKNRVKYIFKKTGADFPASALKREALI